MKSRSFMIILYPDDSTHLSSLDYIKSNFEDYAYILHDKDFTDDGTFKKPHYHVVIKFSNPRSLSSLSSELNIPENYISISYKSYKSALKYLIHFDDKQKFQYSIEEVHGTLKKSLITLLNNEKQEDYFVLQIIYELDNIDSFVSVREFVLIICRLGLWSYFRRASIIFLEILKEHNSKY